MTNPAGEVVQLGYGTGELLATLTDPRSELHKFTCDTLGRLVKDENPAGGHTTFARRETARGHEITRTEAVDGTATKVTTYLLEDLPAGGQRRVAAGIPPRRSSLRTGPPP